VPLSRLNTDRTRRAGGRYRRDRRRGRVPMVRRMVTCPKRTVRDLALHVGRRNHPWTQRSSRRRYRFAFPERLLTGAWRHRGPAPALLDRGVRRRQGCSKAGTCT